MRSSDRTISVPFCLFHWCRAAIIFIPWKSDYMCRRYCFAFQFLCRFTGSFVALNPMQWSRWYFENKFVLFQRNWQHFIQKFRELACSLCFIWGDQYIDGWWFDERSPGPQQPWVWFSFPVPASAMAEGLGVVVVVKWTLQLCKKWLVRDQLTSIGTSLVNTHSIIVIKSEHDFRYPGIMVVKILWIIWH